MSTVEVDDKAELMVMDGVGIATTTQIMEKEEAQQKTRQR